MSNDCARTSRNKNCVTCARWTGPRDTGRFIHPVFVNYDTHTKGKCLGGGYANMQMAPISTCSQWIKWPPLA